MKRISNKTTNTILGISVILLVLLCFMSIAKPINFEKQVAQRELVVKLHLLNIRKAENIYFHIYGYYTDSFDTLIAQKLLEDSVRYIPYSNGKQFNITTSSYVSKLGGTQSLMMCSARYEDYLNGLDEDDIANLTEEANQQNSFPGLKFGDITTPNGNAANWEQ